MCSAMNYQWLSNIDLERNEFSDILSMIDECLFRRLINYQWTLIPTMARLGIGGKKLPTVRSRYTIQLIRITKSGKGTIPACTRVCARTGSYFSHISNCDIYSTIGHLKTEILARKCNDYSAVTWASWRLKLPTTGLFVQQLVHTNCKKDNRAPNYLAFVCFFCIFSILYSDRNHMLLFSNVWNMLMVLPLLWNQHLSLN